MLYLHSIGSMKPDIALILSLANIPVKKDSAFDRRGVTIFQKENVSLVIKRQCVYACIFSF